MAEVKVKLVAVGDCASGKTALLKTFCSVEFPTLYEPTLTCDRLTKQVQFDGCTAGLELFDTPGQEGTDITRASSYPESDVVLICFRVDSPASLANAVDKWLPGVRSRLPEVPIILVANAKDRRDDPAVLAELSVKGSSPVSPDRGQEVARQIQAAGYVECSALTGEGVEEVSETVANVLHGPYLSKSQESTKCAEIPGKNDQERRQTLENEEDEPDAQGLHEVAISLKIVVVGDAHGGKTCLIERFCYDNFTLEDNPTVSGRKYTKYILLNGPRRIKLGLWDTTGNETLNIMRPPVYLQTDVVVMCFNIASPDSFENIACQWMPEICHFLPDVPILLVATKKDLRNDPDIVSGLAAQGTAPVSSEMGQKLAEDVGAADYVECSALTGEGVQEIFEKAAGAAMAAREGSKSRRADKCAVM